MEEIQLIEKRIKKIPRQKIFSAESIGRDSSIKTVKYVLNRLKKKNEIGVISHDLYYRPGKSRFFPGQPIPWPRILYLYNCQGHGGSTFYVGL